MKRLNQLSEQLEAASSIPPIPGLPPRYQNLAKAIAAVIVGVAIAARIIMELF